MARRWQIIDGKGSRLTGVCVTYPVRCPHAKLQGSTRCFDARTRVITYLDREEDEGKDVVVSGEILASRVDG